MAPSDRANTLRSSPWTLGSSSRRRRPPIGQGLLVLDHLVDLLLEGAGAHKLADLHAALLPMRNARSGLVLHRDSHRSRWMTWLAAVRLDRKPRLQDSRKIGGPCSTETLDHLSRRSSGFAVEVGDVGPETAAQVRQQHRGELVNCETQHPFPSRGSPQKLLVGSLAEPGRPAKIMQHLGGVVATCLAWPSRPARFRGARCPRISRSSPSCRPRSSGRATRSTVSWQYSFISIFSGDRR